MHEDTAAVETVGSTSPVEVEGKILDWLRAELDDPQITASENFLDVGGHSLTFARLNRFLGESFGMALDQKTTYREELGTAVAAARPAGTPEPTDG